jgi:hypothetical protein
MIAAILVVAVIFMAGGCNLRFAPSEAQKQNAYLHHRTTQVAAEAAAATEAAPVLQSLTAAAAKQSAAVVAYVGMPDKLPAADTAEDILSAANAAITDEAATDAAKRPDPWTVADNLLEFCIALAGVVGGVYGARAVSVLKTVKEKSVALKEIVAGNELFKAKADAAGDTAALNAFKAAQAAQSPETKALVTEIRAATPTPVVVAASPAVAAT